MTAQRLPLPVSDEDLRLLASAAVRSRCTVDEFIIRAARTSAEHLIDADLRLPSRARMPWRYVDARWLRRNARRLRRRLRDGQRFILVRDRQPIAWLIDVGEEQPWTGQTQ